MAKKDVINKELFLIYVIKIGFDYKGRASYEFLFSEKTEDVWGDEWETVPANEAPQPPDETFVKLVGGLRTDKVNMEVIQNSQYFGVCDAVDDVIALAWEVFDGTESDTDNKNRLAFRFGDKKSVVEDKLYKRDLILNYE